MCVAYMLCLTCVMKKKCCVNCIWNTRVEKHNLKGSEIYCKEWLAISTIKKKMMNGLVHDC